jgi:hypothetical protein
LIFVKIIKKQTIANERYQQTGFFINIKKIRKIASDFVRYWCLGCPNFAEKTTFLQTNCKESAKKLQRKCKQTAKKIQEKISKKSVKNQRETYEKPTRNLQKSSFFD